MALTGEQAYALSKKYTDTHGGGGGGGVSSLDELDDVGLKNLSGGQVLKYNSTSNKWENKDDETGVDTLDGLTDTNIDNLSDGQVLKYNGTSKKWENSNDDNVDNLSDLSDTDIINPTDKQALVYDEESEKWVNAEYVDSLGNLTDVDITNPEEEDVITYNSKTEKWENKQSAIGNTSDDIPYLSRETNNGNRVGSKRVVKDLVGGSVVANQLVDKTQPTATQFGVTFTNNGDGSWTLTGTPDRNNCFYNFSDYTTSNILNPNHVYFVGHGSNKDGIGIALVGQNTTGFDALNIVKIDRIIKLPDYTVASNSHTWARIQISNWANTDIGTVNIIPQVIDLTAMFGTTVADTLYSMEQATAGSGVALFRQLFPNDYYAYQTGSLVSVKPSAMVSGGKTYPISEVDLRGLLSISNGKWVYDGDVRDCGGEITRKYGIVNLGTLDWTYDGSYGTATNVFRASLSNVLAGGTSVKANAMCSKYQIVFNDYLYAHNENVASITVISAGSTNSYLRVNDTNYTDAATFKTAMDGVYLIYELATPTTEYVPAFSEIQDATENGTESFTDARTFPMPVAHHTDYPYGEISDIIFDVPNTREQQNITNRLGDLSKAIAEQNLEKYGYKIGDYFLGTEQTPYVYYLADLDTFYGGYDSYATVNTHHLGVVVNTKENTKWANSNDTSTGYINSVLHTFLTGTVLDNVKADMIARFGGSTGLEHLVSHTKKLTNTTNNWENSNDCYISALSEMQIYGGNVWSMNAFQTGEAYKNLDVFKKYHFGLILGSQTSWLRNIQSTSAVCTVTGEGFCSLANASGIVKAVGLILLK